MLIVSPTPFSEIKDNFCEHIPLIFPSEARVMAWHSEYIVRILGYKCFANINKIVKYMKRLVVDAV